MLKKLLGIFVCTLMICGVLAGATTTTQTSNHTPFEDGVLTIHIPVGDYEITQVNQFQEVSIGGYGHLCIPGKPNLPARIFSLAIPPGAVVSDVQFESKHRVIVPGEYQIAPVVLPRVIGNENPMLYAADQRQYEQNYHSVYDHEAIYPSSIGKVEQSAGYRKYNLVDVSITPVQYYPLSGTLLYNSDITVTIHYTYPEGFTSENIMVDNLPETERTAQDIILNYDEVQQWYPTGPVGRQQYDYVIITLNTLTSAVNPLVQWETTKGRSVTVVTTDWIATSYTGYDLAAKMRVFLREKYPSSEWGITDVCLIGGYDDVPMRRVAQNAGYGQPETDYYYAELSLPDAQSWDADNDHKYAENSDPIDFETEINVGRIPWSDPTTVQHICEKSATYEQNMDTTFKKNILLIGAFFWPDTDNAVLMEKKVDQTWMTDWTMTRLYEDAQSSYPCDYDLTYANVEDVWSEGAFAFVNWAGHGSPQASYEYYPSQPFVDETTCLFLDDDYPAIIFADACSNSDTDELNIGQAMLKQGSVGFVGATKVAYGCPGWNDPYDGSSQSLDYFFTTCCTSGNYTQGEALQWSLREMYVNYLWGNIKYEMLEWGSLWGNPDLTMGLVVNSDPPAQPTTPVGRTLCLVNHQYSYTSSSIDPNGDQIYYQFFWGDGTNSGLLGPYSSGGIGTGMHSWTKLGTYNITVKAQDINGAISLMSESLVVTVVDNTPPFPPTISGPSQIKPRETQTYTFNAVDESDQNVTFDIDWGDGNTLTGYGPYYSGESFELTHTWTKKGTYKIQAKATDSLGLASNWTTLAIICPTDTPFSVTLFLQHLFERFPHAFPILRHMMGF